MHKYSKLLLLLPFFLTLQTYTGIGNPLSHLPSYEKRWNFDSVDFTKVIFPSNFIWGTADSAYQTEGTETARGEACENNWTKWDEEKIANKNGVYQPRTPVEKRPGKACGRWTRYPEDIKLAADIGMNAFRYSIEWSKIEPELGVFDEEAMQHYIDFTWELIRQGLQPIPTLFHHTWPTWFNALGINKERAFARASNIPYFVEFAEYVFKSFQKAGLLKHVTTWLTFNEPAGYALAAYVHGKYPPGNKLTFTFWDDLKRCGTVLKNMLDAHIAIYDLFKAIEPTVKISLAHMMQPLQPYHPWNPLDVLPAKIFNYLLNEVTLNYLQTGNFNWLKLLSTHNPNAIGKLDFIGVNYYTHTLLKMFKAQARPEEKLGNADEGAAGKAIYAEGFYYALKRVAELMPGLPILITENGFDSEDVALRTEYLQKHLYVLHKVMQEGINIRGYLFWTLTDCYGWTSGNSSKHGIYAVNFDTQERTLKPSAQYLVDVIQASKKSPDTIAAL